MTVDMRSLGLYAGSLAPLALLSIFSGAIRSAVGSVGWLLLLGLALACFLVLSGRYLSRLDEAAWQAQKHAWMWGGTVAIALAFLAAPFVAGFLEDWALSQAARGEPGGPGVGAAFMGGALYLVICQAVGFLIAWIVWWARRT